MENAPSLSQTLTIGIMLGVTGILVNLTYYDGSLLFA